MFARFQFEFRHTGPVQRIEIMAIGTHIVSCLADYAFNKGHGTVPSDLFIIMQNLNLNDE
jgi:hypothetical protein